MGDAIFASDMISPAYIGIGDFDRAFTFRVVLAELGLVLKFSEPENGWVGWTTPGVDQPLFRVGRAHDRQPASPGNWQMGFLGGGYGNPLERDPAKVANDVLDGVISVETALKDYGVVVSAKGDIDRAATDKARSGRAL